MSYLLETYWGWMLLALGLGLIVGWLTSHGTKHFHWISRWLNVSLWLFAAGVIIALLKLLPGRAGLWLETGLLFFAAYLVGCLLSAWIKSLLWPVTTSTAAGLFTEPVAEPASGSMLGTQFDSTVRGNGKGKDVVGIAHKPSSVARPNGALDNLKLISGIGHKHEEQLHTLGIYTFSQVVAWNHAEIAWVEHQLNAQGHIEREDWRGQAKKLAAGIETEFAKRVKEGKVESSRD